MIGLRLRVRWWRVLGWITRHRVAVLLVTVTAWLLVVGLLFSLTAGTGHCHITGDQRVACHVP